MQYPFDQHEEQSPIQPLQQSESVARHEYEELASKHEELRRLHHEMHHLLQQHSARLEALEQRAGITPEPEAQ
jgi:chromosome segregation ATPase